MSAGREIGEAETAGRVPREVRGLLGGQGRRAQEEEDQTQGLLQTPPHPSPKT